MKTSISLAQLSAVAVSLALISGSAVGQGAVPTLLNYQGELKDSGTGEAVADGLYDMLFRIYDVESGGTPLWTGKHSSANVAPPPCLISVSSTN